MEQKLIERSGQQCELSKAKEKLMIYQVSPVIENDFNRCIYISEKCINQLEKKEEVDPKFWNFLKESMWSEVPAVQVVSWRMLNRLKNEAWAVEALETMYLDDDLLKWAKAAGEDEEAKEESVHKDCNGTVLQNGDSITLIKSLDVKGSQINAKIGTSVKNIKLVADNTDQIEGKIEGQQIVILTKFVRKSG
ncbi:MAG: PhnA domain-containing protein [Bacteroidetes bacterium]|nr:PhnA domain-containing protein [Bacteroidota bacterium]